MAAKQGGAKDEERQERRTNAVWMMNPLHWNVVLLWFPPLTADPLLAVCRSAGPPWKEASPGLVPPHNSVL